MRAGKWGWRGRNPLAGVLGCPFTPTKVSLFEKGRPSPSTGVASLRPYIEPGVEGVKPHPRGFGGCAPTKPERGSESPTLTTPPRVGPKTLADPKPTRVGKGGGGGEAPSQGAWGMCPQNFKSGMPPTLFAFCEAENFVLKYICPCSSVERATASGAVRGGSIPPRGIFKL